MPGLGLVLVCGFLFACAVAEAAAHAYDPVTGKTHASLVVLSFVLHYLEFLL